MDKTLKNILLKLILVTSTVGTYFFLKHTSSCGCISDFLFKGIDTTVDGYQELVLRKTLLYIAAFLFAHAMFIMTLRIITKKSNPASEQDPVLISTINRVISNTIEQSVIFLGFYAYFIYEIAGDRYSSNQLLAFPAWFIAGRIIFTVGYLIGTAVKITSLRAYGFAIAVAVNLLLIENIWCSKRYFSGLIFAQ